MTCPNRRGFLEGVLAASTMQLAPLLASAAVPTSHAFKFGEFDITIFSDGQLTVPTRFLASNVSEPDIKTWLGTPAATVTPATNVTLVRTPSETILVDVGAGPRFMSGAGKLAENMEAAGFDRKAVTKVVFTHAHPDHIWGTLDDFDEEPMFPSASYLISASEWNFWMSGDVASKLPDDRQNFAPGAKRNLSKIKEKLRTINPGEDIVTGIRAIDTSGHTPGHLSIEVASGRDAMMVLADALTHPTISFAHPEWMPAADHHDPERAVLTRKTLLDRLATDRNRVIGYHLPFPGVGLVERSGTAYRFVANS
jgi:glyoxylase-like metal-dependent hydrolase (beta-lactamase superfamily II)